MVRKREEVGHPELDTVVSSRGQSKYCLATFVERKSSLLIAKLMPNRQSQIFNSYCKEALRHFPYELVKTLTVDKGKEFAGYRELENTLNTDIYSADPYVSSKEERMRIQTISFVNFTLRNITLVGQLKII